MKRPIIIGLLLVLLAGVACVPPQGAAPTSPPSGPPQPPAVQSEWDKLVAEARKEGSLVVIGTSLGATKTVIPPLFRERYGVNIEYIDGLGVQVTAKILAERKAGINSMDVANTGDSTFIVDIKPNGITVPLEPFLILPDIKDPKNWRGGRLPFVDNDRHALAMTAMIIPPVIVNSDIVKEGEIKTHRDLLNPKWKGKIVFGDPRTGGTGNNWFTHVVTQVYKNREDGLKFMRELRKQDPVINRDNRLQVEWIAQGKYPVGIGISLAMTSQFRDMGAPLGFAGMGEPSFLSPGPGNLYLFDKPPHPNAAKLYANWILTKEGQEMFARALGYPSNRADVSNDHMDPALVPQENILVKREEYIGLQAEMRAVSDDIFFKGK